MRQVRIVLPNARCNLHCKYCIDGYWDNKKTDSIVPKEADYPKLFKTLEPFTFGYIGIWGGEPFCNPQLEPLLRTLREKYPGIEMGFLSNGTLLNEDRVNLLNELDISLTISHDGATQGIYRCKDYLTEEYIKLLHKLKKFKGTNSVIHKYNCDLVSIFRFFKEKGLPKDAQVHFEQFKLVEERGMEYLPTAEEYRGLYYSWREILRLAKGGEPMLRSELAKAEKALRRHGLSSCGADSRLTVDLQGNVYHCQVAAETGVKGKVNTALPFMCENCIHARRCRGICPLIADRFRKKMCMLYHLYYDAVEEEM